MLRSFATGIRRCAAAMSPMKTCSVLSAGTQSAETSVAKHIHFFSTGAREKVWFHGSLTSLSLKHTWSAFPVSCNSLVKYPSINACSSPCRAMSGDGKKSETKEGSADKPKSYKGNNLFDILNMLDYFGVGWRVARNPWIRNYPDSYWIITRVQMIGSQRAWGKLIWKGQPKFDGKERRIPSASKREWRYVGPDPAHAASVRGTTSKPAPSSTTASVASVSKTQAPGKAAPSPA